MEATAADSANAKGVVNAVHRSLRGVPAYLTVHITPITFTMSQA